MYIYLTIFSKQIERNKKKNYRKFYGKGDLRSDNKDYEFVGIYLLFQASDVWMVMSFHFRWLNHFQKLLCFPTNRTSD